MNPSDYERAAAIMLRTTILRGIEFSFPKLSGEDQEAMFIGILDRVARMRGWAIKREHVLSEELGE